MSRLFVYLGFTGLLLAHLWLTFSGFYGNDDINYARYAALFSRDQFHLISSDQYGLRWTTIVVTSFFYDLFGINDLTSTLWSFCCMTACGWLLYKEQKMENATQYLLATALFYLGASVIFYSHRLLPDPGIALAIFMSFMLYSRQKTASGTHLKIVYGILFAFTAFFGLITKETILLAAPLWLYWMILDLSKRQSTIFWRSAFVLGIVLLISYLCWFRLKTGSFFFRFLVLEQNGYFNECSFDQLPFSETVRRIGYGLWRAMLLNGDMIILIPSICTVLYKKRLGLSDKLVLASNSFFILVLSANFMTISVTSYVPLCHDPRHFLFLLPFAALSGAPMVFNYFKSPRRFPLLPLCFLVATVIMFLLGAGATKYLYLLMFVLLASVFAFSYLKSSTPVWAFTIAFVLLLFINYFADFFKPKYPFHTDQKNIVNTRLATLTGPAIVYADHLSTAEMASYFLKFQKQQIEFRSVSDSSTIGNSDPLYLLVNGDQYPVFSSRLNTAWYRQHLRPLMMSGHSALYQISPAVIDSIRHQSR